MAAARSGTSWVGEAIAGMSEPLARVTPFCASECRLGALRPLIATLRLANCTASSRVIMNAGWSRRGFSPCAKYCSRSSLTLLLASPMINLIPILRHSVSKSFSMFTAVLSRSCTDPSDKTTTSALVPLASAVSRLCSISSMKWSALANDNGPRNSTTIMPDSTFPSGQTSLSRHTVPMESSRRPRVTTRGIAASRTIMMMERSTAVPIPYSTPQKTVSRNAVHHTTKSRFMPPWL
mmetsp:Transcript_18212/g.42598  ORF Transcript_18212/g.42598 Transcript_18212/m.42598 type:complete len:236 (+) Transcript_18212:95-802(+)